jgi:HlyD family secretion protein
VGAPNPDRKLLPGMTASISFDVDQRARAIRIPNIALRFFPQDRKLVREKDHDLLDGKSTKDDEESNTDTQLSAAEKAAAKRSRKKRHVWVVEADKLKAVEIETGLTDNKFTEIVSADLKVGDKVVSGVIPRK